MITIKKFNKYDSSDSTMVGTSIKNLIIKLLKENKKYAYTKGDLRISLFGKTCSWIQDRNLSQRLWELKLEGKIIHKRPYYTINKTYKQNDSWKVKK